MGVNVKEDNVLAFNEVAYLRALHFQLTKNVFQKKRHIFILIHDSDHALYWTFVFINKSV